MYICVKEEIFFLKSLFRNKPDEKTHIDVKSIARSEPKTEKENNCLISPVTM